MSEISMTEQPDLQQIGLANLSLQDLTQFKQQLDQEIRLFQDSLSKLKIAQNRYQESGSCLDKVTPEVEGNEILVPLTSSMYVTGRLADTKTVLVDIGTGYFAQKGIDDAKDYFKRRVTDVTEQIEKVQRLGALKSKIRDATMEIIEMKIEKALQKDIGDDAGSSKRS